MNEKRVIWKIVVGAVLVLITAGNLPLYMNGTTQANGGLALSALAILGGLYLIYRGLYPTTDLLCFPDAERKSSAFPSV